jgi:hypothetical protein
MPSASDWRSRISFCAFSGEFQKSGLSTAAFSSARRCCALSQSKMPPQQADHLLDFIDGGLDFGAHGDRYLVGAARAVNPTAR